SEEIAEIAVVARNPTPTSQKRACRGPRLIAGIGKAKPLKHGGTEEAEGIGKDRVIARDLEKRRHKPRIYADQR
ncbi:MAG: hypothetical protein ACXV5R_08695, partial [Candidatus Angelobacter sp.]